MLTPSPRDPRPSPVLAPSETDLALREAAEALDAEWHDETILACERALKADAGCAEAFLLLGLTHFDLDEPTKAVEIIEHAHKLNPLMLECVDALAAILVRIGKVGEGLFYAKLATTLAPHPTIRNLLPQRYGTFFKNFETGDPRSYFHRAGYSFEAGAFAEAAAHCRRQLELTQGDPETLRLMGRANLKMGQFEASISAFHAALHASPPEAGDLFSLGTALRATGHSEEAGACHSMALSLSPDDPVLHSAVVAELTRRPGTEAGRIEAAHREWRSRHTVGITPRAPAPADPQDLERPLRVAYLSGAFYQNDFIELFEPILRLHRPKHVTAYCYSDTSYVDLTTEGLMGAATRWTDIAGIDDETVWEILRGDEIDIAVDLSGHFEGGRPLVFARRPAPVTLSWLGYPHPLGLPGVDYFLTDEIAWPAAAEAPESGQEIWPLPRAPLAYIAPTNIPDIGPLPATQSGAVTFGVKCDLTLITPALIRDWAEMLWSQDNTRLLICNRFDQDEASVQRVADLFSHFGLRTRMDVVNMADNFMSDFAFYDHVDIALDTGSCDSLVENCRALWMGVPVIGLAGDHHGARLGTSLLAGAGRSDWSVESTLDFAALAGRLSGDLAELAELRATLRDQVRRSALSDPVGLYGALEVAYREMWRRCAAGA